MVNATSAYARITAAALHIPTDGRGSTAAARGTVSTGTPVYTGTSFQVTTLNQFANFAVGDTIVTIDGFWATLLAKGALQSDVQTVSPWRKRFGNLSADNRGELPAGATLLCFPPSVLTSCRRCRIQKFAVTAHGTAVAETLSLFASNQTTVIDQFVLPASATAPLPAPIDYGEEGIEVGGIFFVQTSATTTKGTVEFRCE
jgi:hypothetical protein